MMQGDIANIKITIYFDFMRGTRLDIVLVKEYQKNIATA